MERLISGESIETYIDEQIVFDQLDMDENAVWSLLLASGYLKVEFVKSEDNAGETLDFPIYSLRITNREVRSMFVKMFKGWFNRSLSAYNNFIKALLVGDIESMNEYMNDVALNTFSLFDAGKKVSEKRAPENFYHGFVLGLMVDQVDNYIITSNRGSGDGRYDICLIPRKNTYPGIIMELKWNKDLADDSLDLLAKDALSQIDKNRYDLEIKEDGITDILKFGIAFSGKKIQIQTK